MNNSEISTNNSLGVDLVQSLNTSPSCSTFLPEEDASTCPLLPNTPSPPPPMNFNDPLTPNILTDDCIQPELEDDGRTAEEESSSCSGSSGCIDGQVVAGTTTVFNPNVYQHFGKVGKNGEVIPESETKLHAHLNLPDSKDVPSFVYWNWTLIRQCSFLFFVASVIAMAAVVVTMIYNLPTTCNPKTVWFEGSVFYEIHPLRFPDSNNDGLGDFKGLQNRVDYLTKLGVVGVRLNSIFQHDHPQNVTTLLGVDDVLGNVDDLRNLVETFHKNNLSLILDLPIYPFITKLEPVLVSIIDDRTKHPMINAMEDGTLRVERTPSEKNTVVAAISFWKDCNVDGFYIKGLENMYDDPLLLENLRAWKALIGSDRILMINNQLLENVKSNLTKEEIVRHVDLVDIFIDVTNGTEQIAKQIKESLKGVLKPGNGAYIQWSIGGVSEHRSHESYALTPNGALAATLMSLMLPGSPNVYHGEELSHPHFSEPIDSQHKLILKAMAWNTVTKVSSHSENHSHQSNADDFDTIAQMISLRDISPSMYKNIIQKKGQFESNTLAMYQANILILMRWYPRRNTFVSISNFGNANVSLDLTSYFYSGKLMIGGKSHDKIYFDRFEIGPSQTIVVKLDK